MKKLIALAALAVSLNAHAYDVSIVGVLFVPVVVGTVTVWTGNGEALCKRLGGTYKPAPPPVDVCPDGKWANLLKSPK